MEQKIVAASNGKGAVALIELGGKPCLYKYAPKALGKTENRIELNALINRAALKLGFKPDRRCKGHWRKVT